MVSYCAYHRYCIFLDWRLLWFGMGDRVESIIHNYCVDALLPCLAPFSEQAWVGLALLYGLVGKHDVTGSSLFIETVRYP